MNINDYIKKKSRNNISPEEAVKKYAAMDEQSLMAELFKTAEEGRASGELTDEVIDNFYATVSPMLSPEQSERMRELIHKMKK